MARLVALGTGLLILIAVLSFGEFQQRMMAAVGEHLEPAAWAEAYPHHVAAFMRTATNYGRTRYGGSEVYDKLEANPFRQRAWAGNAFALEYNAARGHHYAQIDQRQSRRTREREQPAGCVNCHAAEAPDLIATFGWDALHRMRYDDLRGRLHVGMSCGDCHEPETMALQITRPAFVHALQRRGVDIAGASRQDMRSYVCAQCHVEYYFSAAGQELILPWAEGLGVDDIERYFDEIDFSDWRHAETGATLIKVQHPDFELYSTGKHAALGVACADCHMPAVQAGGLAISDHWIRSPLVQIGAACRNCHRAAAEDLLARVHEIQDRTTAQLATLEAALSALMDAIVAAQAAGSNDAALAAARRAQRRAQLRWDFIDAENSTGFHAPDEAARVLGDALELARGGLRDLANERAAE